MFNDFKKIPIIFIFSLPVALTCTFTFARGSEEIASPTFDLNNNQYIGLDNPILFPSNDNRSNMMLLLSDLGLANLKPIQIEKKAYGK